MKITMTATKLNTYTTHGIGVQKRSSVISSRSWISRSCTEIRLHTIGLASCGCTRTLRLTTDTLAIYAKIGSVSCICNTFSVGGALELKKKETSIYKFIVLKSI